MDLKLEATLTAEQIEDVLNRHLGVTYKVVAKPKLHIISADGHGSETVVAKVTLMERPPPTNYNDR